MERTTCTGGVTVSSIPENVIGVECGRCTTTIIHIQTHRSNLFQQMVALGHQEGHRFGYMEDCGENNMYCWSDSLSHPRECHWSAMCMPFHSYLHIQTHRSNQLL